MLSKAISIVREMTKISEMAKPFSQSEAVAPKVWKPPQLGVYKINSDAATFEGGWYGLGGVMRDSVGDVMVSTSHNKRKWRCGCC